MTEPQSFTDYVLELFEHFTGGLLTEREFAHKVAEAAAGRAPFTDEATDLYIGDEAEDAAKGACQ
jgi:hypothetical protein